MTRPKFFPLGLLGQKPAQTPYEACFKLSPRNAEKVVFLEVWNRFFDVFVWSNNDIQWLVSLVLEGNRA